MGYWDAYNYVFALGVGSAVIGGVVMTALTVMAVLCPCTKDAGVWTFFITLWSILGGLCIIQPAGFRYLIRGLRRRLLSVTLHKPTGFNLVVGMTNKQVYKELHRKTSGETEQEVQFLLAPEENRSANRLLNKAESIFNQVMKVPPALEVIDANDKYAVIKKTRLYQNGGHISKDEIHYLTGINDEGYYFVHAIKEPEVPLDPTRTWPKNYKTGLDELISYVNREDEGYKRLQGDVLYKFIRFTEHQGFIRVSDSICNLSGHTYETNVKPLDLPVLTPIKLGNHEVYYTGNYMSISGEDGQYWGILGTKVIMKHNQHKDVTVEIPSGHCMVLTHQRSRQLQLPDKSISRINFD